MRHIIAANGSSIKPGQSNPVSRGDTVPERTGATVARGGDALSRAVQGLIRGIGFVGACVIMHHEKEQQFDSRMSLPGSGYFFLLD